MEQFYKEIFERLTRIEQKLDDHCKSHDMINPKKVAIAISIIGLLVASRCI